MSVGATDPAFSAGRIDELQRENNVLKEQLRRFSTQANVAQGAYREAVAEKETAANLVHHVAVEERVTRAAVEAQSSAMNIASMVQFVNFLLLLVIALGLFAWLPGELGKRVNGPAPTSVTAPAGTTIVR